MLLKDNFQIGENGHLSLHGVDLSNLCGEYGSPLFVFDKETLENTYERLRQAFESVYPKTMVCYSIKTNDNLSICQTLKAKGAYAEVASELDLHIALKSGFEGENIILDGPFKPIETLKKAIKNHIRLINVESFAELERVNRVAGELGVKQAIGIRVNPFKEPGVSKYFHINELVNAAYCNLESRFGLSVEETYIAIEQAMKLENLSLDALMSHPYRTATRILLPMIHELYERWGLEIKYLNIGGGFNPGGARFIGNSDLVKDFLKRKIGVKSDLHEFMRIEDIEATARSVIGEIKQSLGDIFVPTVIVEPGRYITSAAGILLTRVDHVKNVGSCKWAFIDAGTNLLPRFGATELRKTVIVNKANIEPEEEVNLVGPLLYVEDYISLKTYLPKVTEGDVLSIFDCGAYTLSRSSQFLYPRPAAILLDSKGNVTVIRERETAEDVLYKDRI